MIRDLIGEDQSLEIFGFEEIDIACTEKKSNRAWATKTYFPKSNDDMANFRLNLLFVWARIVSLVFSCDIRFVFEYSTHRWSPNLHILLSI